MIFAKNAGKSAMSSKIVSRLFPTVGDSGWEKVVWVILVIAGLLALPARAYHPMGNPYWNFSGPLGRVESGTNGFFQYFNSLLVYSKNSILLAAGSWDYGCDDGCITVVDDDVFRSVDNGNSWSRVADLKFRFISAFQSLGSTLFTGSMGGKVYRSLDAGNSREPVSEDMYVFSLYSMGDSVLFAGTSESGVYRFVNTGSWVSLGDGLGDATVQSLHTIGPLLFAGTVLFAGTGNGVFRSLDNGDSWTPVNDGLSGAYVYSLYSVDSVLFAGTVDGIYRADNALTTGCVDFKRADRTTIIRRKGRYLLNGKNVSDKTSQGYRMPVIRPNVNREK